MLLIYRHRFQELKWVDDFLVPPKILSQNQNLSTANLRFIFNFSTFAQIKVMNKNHPDKQ
jgi:hypothetical protein